MTTMGDDLALLKKVRKLADAFRLAANSHAFLILDLLSHEEQTVASACEELGVARKTLTHPITLLRLSGMIEGRRDGRSVFYRLTPKGEGSLAVARILIGQDGT